ncbi:MAG: tetratricopeptide repeat protein, partial [Myxococcota bacterium]
FYPARFFRKPLQDLLQRKGGFQALYARAKAAPNSTQLQLQLGHRLLLRRQIQPARRLFRALQHRPETPITAHALFAEARTYTRLSQYPQALSLLRKLLRRYPNHPVRADAFRLQLLCHKKRYHKDAYKKTLRLFRTRFPHDSTSFE